jgi:hypothetical protein
MRFYTKWKSAMIVAVSLFGFAAFAAVTKAALEDETTTTTNTDEGTTQDEAAADSSATDVVVVADPINGEWASIKSWTFEGLADSIYTAKTPATYSTEKVNVASTDCDLGTGEFDGLAFQGANKFFFYNGGLYQGNGGGRKVCVLDVEKGQRVTVVTTDASFALATTDIAELDTEASSGETFVYNVTADGNLGFTMTRYLVIKSINIEAKTKWMVTSSWTFEGFADSIYTAKTAATYSEETVKIASTDCNLGTGDFAGLAFQDADKFFYYNGGLYQGNGGGRKVGIIGVEAGQRVTVVTTDASFALATTDIAELDSEASSGETFVYNVTADGNLGFTMARYLVIKSIQVETKKQLTFTTWQFDNQPDSVYTNKVAATYSGETVNIASIDCNLGTGDFDGLAFQGANKFFYYNGGLYQGNGGGRKVGVLNMEAGAVITVVTTDASFALATTDIAELNSELSSGETFVYNVTADGNVGFTMARYLVIKSISVVAPKASIKAPEITVAAHNDWDVATITLTCATDGATIYYSTGDSTQVYSEPFTVSKSGTITAWSEKDGKSSKEVTKNVTAGYVAAPTATISKVIGTSREVTLADVATGAVITYFVGDATEGVVFDAPFTITDSTEVKAVAVVGEFVSDTLTTKLAAGTEVRLAGVTYAVATVADSALAVEYTEKNLKDIIVKADESSVLCTPEVEVEYTYIPYVSGIGFDETQAVKATVAAGDTLKALAIGKLTAVAKNANYATSEETELYLKLPSELVAERVYDFSRAAWGGHTSDLTVTISSTVETINSTTYGTVAFGDSIAEGFLVQTGTTWLKRGGYDGFYQMNGGNRCVGVQNLEAGNIVKFYGHTGNADFALTLVDNGVATLDAAETAEGSVYTFDIIKGGSLAVSMARYGYLDSVIVYSDPNAPKTPSINLESANGASRFVSLAASPEGVVIYYALGSVGADSTVVWGDDVVYNGGNIEVVTTETPYIRAYSWSFGSSSEVKERYFAPGVVALNQPVIKYVGSTDAGKQFVITVDNSDQIDSNPQGIYYTLPGAEAVAYTDTLVVANDVYGWLTAVSQLEGCETSAAAYRYLDNRASYNETYVAVTAETAEMPAEAADLEIADIATLNATLAAAFKPTGRIFFHKAVHAGYNSLVLPFAMTSANFESGVVEVTDEAGNVLTRGTDFEVVRLQATTSFLSLEADLAAGENVYTGNLVANTQSYLLKVSDDLVGHELIFVSGENAQNLSINKVDLSSLAAEGKWLLKTNATFAPVASEVPVYLVNEDGSALVLQEAGTKVPPYSFAVIGDSATVASTTTIPLLSGATAIESLNQELKEQGIIFDLQGRRAGALKAGEIYFRDGKKFIQR